MSAVTSWRAIKSGSAFSKEEANRERRRLANDGMDCTDESTKGQHALGHFEGAEPDVVGQHFLREEGRRRGAGQNPTSMEERRGETREKEANERSGGVEDVGCDFNGRFLPGVLVPAMRSEVPGRDLAIDVLQLSGGRAFLRRHLHESAEQETSLDYKINSLESASRTTVCSKEEKSQNAH